MLLHEVANPQVYSIDFPGFVGLSPGVFSLLWGFSSFPRIYFVFGRVASLLVADEAFAVPHVLHSFTGREIDLVYINGVRIPGWSSGSSCLSWRNIAVSPTPEFPK